MRIFPTPKPKPTTADLRREFTEAHAEEFLTRPVVAAGIGYSLSWLELAATRGGGPPYYKRGRRVLYRKGDVLAWLEQNSQRVSSTSEYAPSPSSAGTISPAV